jgi:hypothetical protein
VARRIIFQKKQPFLKDADHAASYPCNPRNFEGRLSPRRLTIHLQPPMVHAPINVA